MAGNRVSAGPEAIAAVEHYLTDLSARLRGPRTVRRRILAEVADGLTETIGTHTTDGMPPMVAADTAVREFGDPATVAGSFAEELATATARRTIAAFIVTGPLVGIWWLLLLHPEPWRTGILSLLIALPILPVIGVAVATALGTLAGTGRLMRWLPEATGARALSAATAIATLCLATDLTILGVLTAHLATGIRYPVLLATVAVAASIARIGAAVAAIRSIRATGHRLAPPSHA